MNPYENMMAKLEELSSEELRELMLKTLDKYLANAQESPDFYFDITSEGLEVASVEDSDIDDEDDTSDNEEVQTAQAVEIFELCFQNPKSAWRTTGYIYGSGRAFVHSGNSNGDFAHVVISEHDECAVIMQKSRDGLFNSNAVSGNFDEIKGHLNDIPIEKRLIGEDDNS